MKKNVKIILFTILAIIGVIMYPAKNGFANTINLGRKEDIVYNNIPEEAVDYAKKNYKTYCKLVLTDPEFNLKFSIERLSLGRSFFIYDVSCKGQQLPIYEFPIMYKGKCILILEVSKAEDTWTGNISRQLSDALNRNNYSKQNCLLYTIGDFTFFECKDYIDLLEEHMEIEDVDKSHYEKLFLNLSYNEKVKIIQKNTKEYSKINTDTLLKDKTPLGYTPKLSYNSLEHVECNVSKYLKSQGSKPYCWAACIASTKNYYSGKNITAAQVVKKTGYSYPKPNQVMKAFRKYGFSYSTVFKEAPSLSNINACLRNHYLVTIEIGTLDNNHIHKTNHSELIFGTKYSDGKSFVKVYNPQKKGSIKWVRYNNVKTIFERGWGWRSTYLPNVYKPK